MLSQVAVMNRWRKPIPLGRIWCLFELVCAMVRPSVFAFRCPRVGGSLSLVSQRSETTELLIVLSEAERQSLRAGLTGKGGSKIITQMLVDIDVEEAKAEQESDHRQLSVRLLSLLQLLRDGS